MAFYDHFAKGKATGLGSLIEFKTKEKEFNNIAKYLNKDSEILEIGAGQGILANIFTQNGFNNYDVVEPNDIMRNNMINGISIRVAKNYFIPNLQEQDASYDCIVLTHVFEHLNDCNEAKKFISEVRRVLKSEGLIFIVCPDYLDFGKDFYHVDFSHNYITTVRRVMELFLGENLETVTYKYTYACFGGLFGYLISRFVKLATFWARGNCLEPCHSMSAYIDIKAYKLRLTFSRNFSIVGRKTPILD